MPPLFVSSAWWLASDLEVWSKWSKVGGPYILFLPPKSHSIKIADKLVNYISN
jgi:hypothetical protein